MRLIKLAPLIVLAAGLSAAGPGQSVVILDFGAHIALAHQPQFDALIALSSDGGRVWGVGSGTWIGNDGGHGYVLTAAHNFDEGYKDIGLCLSGAGRLRCTVATG